MAHTIHFTRATVEEIRRHAAADYPNECCGALLGDERDGVRHVARVMPIANVSEENRRRRFSVAPLDYLRAEREAAAGGMTLLGFYHSHPDHPARPSETDRAFAQPGFSYPIIAVTRTGPDALTSWRLDDNDAWYVEEDVSIAP